MRFYILSDLHLGNKEAEEDAINRLNKLCCDIRSSTPNGDTVLFVILGDVADKGDTLSFDVASRCLDSIYKELTDFSVKFEFVPGNHDLDKENKNLISFDALIAKYGASHSFNDKTAYSCVYENVNFIFADSTLSRDYGAPGKLSVDDIRAETKPGMSNIVFCHHALTEMNDGGHDTIENAEEVRKQLNSLNISFFFHGHVHHSNLVIPKEGMVEIGLGSLSADTSWNKALFNQFSVCYIQDGQVVWVERWVNTSDCEQFACNQLYPHKESFSDPNTVLKECYEKVEDYIPRKVLTCDKAYDNSLMAVFTKPFRITLREALVKHKKVLLLSDAGMGKSLEIQNLAYELHDSMHTYLFSLKDYSNQDIFDLLPEHYKSLSPNRYALLFDGYDELSVNCQEEFEKKLRIFLREHVGVHIVITSRTNFCHINDNKCSKFDGFEIFVLDKLNRLEVEEYVLSKEVDYERFSSIASTRKVFDLLFNPFYLIRLVEIFNQKGDLPLKTKLMNELVAVSFNNDDAKFSGNLDDHYRSLFLQLERIALGMQLMHKQTFDDREEFQDILQGYDARTLAKKSGLLKREGETWAFVHNNFREYLAAKCLSRYSREQVISIISDGENIKPYWVNTLGYLTGIELDWNLFDWLSEKSPSVMVKFESDRMPPEMRNKVFRSVFEKYERLNLHFNDELCDEAELADFAKSCDTIRFLINKIVNPCNMPSQYTAINILRHFQSLMGLDDDVKECLVSCCEQYPKTHKSICRLCLLTLAQHKFTSSDLTSHLMHLFGESNEDYIRLGMYEYLMVSGEQNTYVQYFLDGIKYARLSYSNDDDMRIGNESTEMAEGLKAMNTIESVSRVINCFSDERHINFYGADKVISSIFQTATKLYNDGVTEIYKTVEECYIKSAAKWNRSIATACVDFFMNTATDSLAIVTVAQIFEEEPQYASDFIYGNPNAIDLLKKAYLSSGIKSTTAFHRFVEWYVRDNKKYQEYSAIIKAQEGVDIAKYREPIDYEAIRLKGLQEYFDIIFDQEKRTRLLSELLSIIGDSNVLAGKLLDSTNRTEHNSAHWHLQSEIYRYVEPEFKVVDFFDCVNIEKFIVDVTSNLLESNPKLIVSDEQKGYLKHITEDMINKGIFRNAVSYNSGCTIRYPVAELLWIIQHFEYIIDSDTLLDLTELPSHLFNTQNDEVKYEYLERYLTSEQIKNRLIENVSKGKVKEYVLRDHIEYFSKQKDGALGELAYNICKTSSDYFLRSSAWRYLYGVFGADYITEQIIPIADGELLVEINGACKEISREVLRLHMEKQYRKKHNMQLLAHMITLESKMGLKAYYRDLKRLHRIPEGSGPSIDGPTAAIESVKNPEFLPLLEKLLVIVLDKRFVDSRWRGLRITLKSAFVNCGKSCPEKVRRIILRHRPKESKRENDFRYCNYLINEVECAYKSAIDIPSTLEEAKKLLPKTSFSES